MKYYKVITEEGWSDVYEFGKIYPADYLTYGSTLDEDREGYPKDFKLSTKAAYNKQEGITVKPKQTKLKQTEMKNYSIEGSKALKTAFVEECKLKLYSGTTITEDRLLTSSDMPKGGIQSTGKGYKASQHFVLPKDWDAAVKYVTEFNTPKPTFKVGDWVVILKSEDNWSEGDMDKYVGNVVQITSVNTDGYNGGTDIRFVDDGCWNWSSASKHYRLATAEEIKRATNPIFKMAGYTSTINKSTKTISFGCQTYTKAEVKLLLDAAKLCERVGYSAKVKASGFVVNETDILTPDSLTKILAQLK